jgi:hypothetical protein
MNKFGIHAPNKGFRDIDGMLGMGVDCFTVLQLNSDLIPRIRQARPHAVILVRHYLSKWTDNDPVEWARTCAVVADGLRPYTLHHTLANEQNLPEEGGGMSREWFIRINDWNLKSIAEFKRLCPWAVVHWPALASGHSEDKDDFEDGTIGYEICRPSIELADVLDHHDYWNTPDQLFGTELSLWYAFRFRWAHEFFPQKPIFISECGWMGHGQDPNAGDHYLYFFGKLYDYPYVIGATPFIWDSGPEHGGQIWAGNERLIQAITQAQKPEGEGEMALPDWITDIRGETTNHTGLSIARPIGIMVHHGGKPAPLENLLAYLKGAECAYHFVIAPDGRIYYQRDISEVCWHAGNDLWNSGGIAVIFAGCFMDAPPTDGPAPSDAAFASFARLRDWLFSQSVPNNIVGHKDIIPSTQCPGDWYPRFRSRLLEGMDSTELELLREQVRKLELERARMIGAIGRANEQVKEWL